MTINSETEVYKLSEFDKNKNYEFALRTRTIGLWPNEQHFTTNQMKFLGKYVRSERWGGWGDGSSGAEIFDNNGVTTRIEYDYDGRTCFRVVV